MNQLLFVILKKIKEEMCHCFSFVYICRMFFFLFKERKVKMQLTADTILFL